MPIIYSTVINVRSGFLDEKCKFALIEIIIFLYLFSFKLLNDCGGVLMVKWFNQTLNDCLET